LNKVAGPAHVMVAAAIYWLATAVAPRRQQLCALPPAERRFRARPSNRWSRHARGAGCVLLRLADCNMALQQGAIHVPLWVSAVVRDVGCAT
jgi:hypothetical protein